MAGGLSINFTIPLPLQVPLPKLSIIQRLRPLVPLPRPLTLASGELSDGYSSSQMLSIPYLVHFNLSEDASKGCLIDPITYLQFNGVLCAKVSPSPSSPLPVGAEQFTALLQEFPSLTSSVPKDTPVKHAVLHHIATTGPPVHVRLCRLPQECLCVAKQEFDHMVELGIVRPSSSPWSSPLHMVPKKAPGDWRPCSYYQAMNTITVPDWYPISHKQDFASNLHGCSVFSKIDLVWAYHQVPVAPEDILKTVIATPFGLFEFV